MAEDSVQQTEIKQHLSKKQKVVIVVILCFLLATLKLLFLIYYTKDDGLFCNGVKVGGIDLSSLSMDEAKEKVEQDSQKLKLQKIQFKVDNDILDITRKELGLKLKIEEALTEAYNIGRQGNLLQKAYARFMAGRGIDIPYQIAWDNDILKDTLTAKFGRYNQSAIDASFAIGADNNMKIIPEQQGREIDLGELTKQVTQVELNTPITISVNFRAAGMPKLTAAELEKQKITGLLASYTTKFDPGLAGRTENIRLAAKALDGKIIPPGTVFSFNQSVGERTVEAGYQEAMIIVSGAFVPGLGGGICQVSSTLYNVALMADLDIVERHNHALAITYIPLGQDATVSYPDLDLKFQNNSEAYLLLRSKVQGDSLTFDLFGKVVPEREVLINNVTEAAYYAAEQRIIDNSLSKGNEVLIQGGQPGYNISTYRTVKMQGKIVKQENLSKSKYQALPRIVRVGPS